MVDKRKLRKGKTYEEIYGKENSKKIKIKSSISHQGQIPKNIDLLKRKGYPNSTIYGALGHKHSEETKRRMSISQKGKQHHRTKPAWNKGKSNWWCKGEKNPSWKGGITKENEKIRSSQQYKQWRMNVFIRDNWTCKICEKVGGNLEVHHIQSFAKFPEDRLNVDNGVTLCKECHDLTKNERWE